MISDFRIIFSLLIKMASKIFKYLSTICRHFIRFLNFCMTTLVSRDNKPVLVFSFFSKLSQFYETVLGLGKRVTLIITYLKQKYNAKYILIFLPFTKLDSIMQTSTDSRGASWKSCTQLAESFG